MSVDSLFALKPSPAVYRRDTRELLKSASVDDAYAFVDSNSHPRLWRNLAEHALEALDFTTADKAFVRCADYQVRHWHQCACNARG